MVLEYPAPLHVFLRDVVWHVVRLVLVRPETVPLVPLLGENSLGTVLNSDLILNATLALQINTLSMVYTHVCLGFYHGFYLLIGACFSSGLYLQLLILKNGRGIMVNPPII